MSYIERIHNAQDNSIIEIEISGEDLIKLKATEAAWENEQAAIEAAAAEKAEAKASAENKLTALGLTKDEIAALRG